MYVYSLKSKVSSPTAYMQYLQYAAINMNKLIFFRFAALLLLLCYKKPAFRITLKLAFATLSAQDIYYQFANV